MLKLLSTRLFLLSAAACLGAYAQTAVFHEDFENQEANAFQGLTIVRDQPGEGKASAQLVIPPEQDKASCRTPKLIPVQADSWYRLTFLHRNDIKNGELKIGVLESTDDTKVAANFMSWQWKSLSLNIMDWNPYSFEFKTAKDTKALTLHISTENQFNGSSWWDDIRLERFTPVYDPIEIKPFRAAATYTDIPTKMAYRVVKGEMTRANIQVNTTYYWDTLDLAKESVTVLHRELPEGSAIRLALKRGTQPPFFVMDKPAAGSGEVAFALDLTAVPEGIYEMTATLTRPDGKSFVTPAKEIWRIQQAKCATPKLEPITTTSTGPNRQRLLNGKIYHPVYMSTAPTWGLFYHHKKYTRPDLDTYMANLQEQFGQDCVMVWAWRANRWDDKKPEFRKEAIRQYREYLDYLQAHNFYGSCFYMFVTERGRPKEADYDDIRELVEGVKDHPAVVEWYLDEPEIPRYSPEMMRQCYETIKKADPNHNVLVNLCDPDKFHLYAPSSDIGSFDAYPFPGMSLLENDRRMKKLAAANPTAPLDSYLQMFNFSNLDMPNFEQIRAEFIFDRISGSQALIAFAWSYRDQSMQTDMELQSYFRAILFMFRSLNPVLDRAVKLASTVQADTPYVKSMMLKDGAETVALLVNISPDTPAKVTVPAAGAAAAENFFDAAWSYPLADGACRLKLRPNQAVVIRFK